MPVAARSSLAAAAALVLVLCCLPSAAAWEGRGTFYDDNDQGSCRYRDVWKLRWYAAYPDGLPGFAGSCGKCYSVGCLRKDFRDGYGQWMSRWFACRDEHKRVVVKITDSCPCQHANAYSNKRWCCNDMPHLDLAREAFKELADERWGVIALKWDEVDCNKVKLGPQ